MPHLADVARLVFQLDGSRHAVSLRQAVRLRRADEREMGSGGPVKAVLKRCKHYAWKLCWYASSATPWSVFLPSMASFLKRTANAPLCPVSCR